MNPDDSRLLQAYADGELDPARALELEARLAKEPALRAACEGLRALSAAIRDQADYHPAPAALAARLRAALPDAAREAAPPAARAPRRQALGWRRRSAPRSRSGSASARRCCAPARAS